MLLHIDVARKIATFQKRGGYIVCGNSDYTIKFTFDGEWNEYPTKTARFIWNGHFHDVDFTGEYCAVPVLYDTDEVEVGVYAGDLKTTTSAFIGCYRSILCESATPTEENDRSHANDAKEAADRAEAAAELAEDYASKVIIEGGGISAEVERRLTALENNTAPNFTTDKTLTLSSEGVLSVNTVDSLNDENADNTLPVTAGAVATTVGNIEILLQTI